MPKITINTQSIKNELRTFSDKPANAILEYIWNGFDAEADNIQINYSFPQSTTGLSMGYPLLEIADDGVGWEISNIKTANLFLVSPKKHLNYKSLPQGRDGVGRFTFYSFADKATWETIFKGEKFRLELKEDSLDSYELLEDGKGIKISKGTRVMFNVSNNKLDEVFFKRDLVQAIKLEFCWFLKLFPQKNIYLNNEKIKITDLILNEETKKIKIDKQNFDAHLVQWKEKPTKESSKYYFLNDSGAESFKKTSGLNLKSDDFFHSAYVKSSFFNELTYKEEAGDENQKELFETQEDKGKKKILNRLMQEINRGLEKMRKPYLYEISDIKIKEWKDKDLLPKVTELGIQQEDYDNIVREVYVAVPQLFTNSSDDQRKVILNLFSSLLSTDSRDFLLKVLDQVYSLSKEDRQTLSELLDRTTLSNIVKMAREVDSRLHVISALEEILLTDKSKYTKEVQNLQRILDNNFWIFGEGYRLFSSTEGSIRTTLTKFKDSVLRKTEDKIVTKSRKELDLLLIKQETTSDNVACIVVEIKRPTITLGKKELDQIKEYMNTILAEPATNGENIKWHFYLIGCDFDSYVKKEISNASQGKEMKERGLAYTDTDNGARLYVKKWSDIINVEQKSKYKYLQDKFKIELKKLGDKDVDEVTNSVA